MFHAQAQSYTPTGKRRGLRGAFLSTTHTGTGTGSGGGFGKQSRGDYNAIGVVAAVAASTAVAVHHLDQNMAATEIARIEDKAATETARIEDKAARIEDKAATEIARIEDKAARIEDKAATEIKLAATEIKRVEGERRLSEERLRAEVDRYKYDLQLRHTQDYKPYQAAKEQANKERGGTGGPQKEEETH